ncbi:hypothetical protein GFK26_18685 [Variovorax paradoxus]|uniref:Uncharacterized protein n=1 Tax=Variovorax paradoxus TaxID=34073 RepID=A0A5Q0M815_VARPD|nr:hypothetical protein [Variovorax paradoxus]QFZ84655.1 hypothetical protein GFK26_18685 [Variovorax paradoxus]
MRLRDVVGMEAVLSGDDLVSGDPIWDRDGGQLTNTDIQLFYARSGLKRLRQNAIDAVDKAQAVVIRALFCGELPRGAFAALVLHEAPPTPYLADEFVDGLVKLAPARRGACIYMLENRMAASEVTDLLWSSLDPRGFSQTSMEVLKAATLTRHIKLPYVFWEWATPNIASPLLDLQASIESAFECGVAALQERYDRMVMVDRRSDETSFLSLVKQLGG